MTEEILDDFPTARTLTYLNSASISLMPQPAINSMIEFQQRIAAGGTIGFDEEAETQALEVARDETSSLIHTDHDEVAVLSSATEGIPRSLGRWISREEETLLAQTPIFPALYIHGCA